MQSESFQEILVMLKAAKDEYQRKLKGIEKAIAALEAEDLPTAESSTIINQSSGKIPKDYISGYNSSWGLATKFLFLLNKENRFLHFREAGDIISKLDGKGDPKDLTSKLSSSTAKYKKNGTLVKVQPTGKNIDTFWGMSKWLNEDGSIKEGHEFNEDFLSNQGEPSLQEFIL